MQDKYVGDVGDFGKYGLLRALFSNSPFKLGVNWCLVEKEDKKNDGKHTAYLNINGRSPREDHPAHVEETMQRVSAMISGNWGVMFDLIELEEGRI